jgi:signal peptidase I
MEPTLNGGQDSGARAPWYDSGTHEYHHGDRVHFGITDESNRAKRNLKRYDIVTVYYPWSDYSASGELLKNADYKIKRVIALPGETFKIEQGVLMVKYEDGYKVIERVHQIEDGGNPSVKDVTEQTLSEGQYWVMGDHRNNSYDCASTVGSGYRGPIKYENIIGVLTSVQGTAEYYIPYICDNCGKEINDEDYLSGKQTTCSKCGGHISANKGTIRNEEYTYPRII